MTVPVVLGAYAAVLGLAFGGALLVGDAVAPLTAETPVESRTTGHAADRDETDGHALPEAADHGSQGGEALPGLAVSEAGYRLLPERTALPAGRPVPFRFTVRGPDGDPVTDFATAHEKEMHLIVVRRDLTGYAHLHPTRSVDGTWSVPLELGAGGVWRAFADFEPAGLGRGLTLGVDLHAAGEYGPAGMPAASPSARVGGYRVTLSGTPSVGDVDLTFTVRRNGGDVTLAPYLGAFGHLVSLRAGDLAYLHTHPAQDAHPGERGGPAVRFTTEFPSPGTYRLFLDFRAGTAASSGGVVRTAAFTVEVPS